MKKTKFSLDLLQDISGNVISISGVTMGSGSPKVYLQGGTHGGELTYFVIESVYKSLIKNYKTGTVTFVPISNPLSWNQRVYSSTLGKFSFQDGKDWNRGYNNPDGSLAGIRASKLMNFLIDYDYVIDLHTSRKSLPFGIFAQENLDIKILKDLGMKFNYLISTKTDSSMMSSLIQKGKIAFEIECGSHDSFEVNNIEYVSNRIIKLLSSIGIIAQSQSNYSSEIYTFPKWETYFAPKSGFIKYKKDLGDICEINSDLCTLSSFDGEFRKQIIKTKSKFILLKKLQTNIIWTGDEVIQGIDFDSLTKIS